MPKKRHQTKYSKPPSVAPPSLSSSSSSQANSGRHARSVNELLADMRRSRLNPHAVQASSQLAPSVPPSIREILQIPETPAPPPRRPQRQRRDVNGRRIPPGPPPPRSWLSLHQPVHAPATSEDSTVGRMQRWPLPGMYHPDDGSLVDILLRRIAADWPAQREWNRFYLYTLPSRMKTALLYNVSILYRPGLSVEDLKLVLMGPPQSELAQYGIAMPDAGILNEDMFYLDLTGLVGQGVSLKAIGDLLFPATDVSDRDLQESWDAPEPSIGPSQLVPNLTHLSLAVSPGATHPPYWRHLLSISTKMGSLTHLNISGWPAPSLTPNAMLAKVVSSTTGRTSNYGGTNPYSHILDDDWSEAVLVLRRLSKALYRLEYLDLTGCGDWLPALRKEAESEDTQISVDWASDWGKITTLKLCSGYVADVDSTAQLTRLWQWKHQAVAVEKHIIAQRAGRGRFINVEMDILVDEPRVANAG
ncbi:uncharacterized protein BCR38DRAFT_410029 [Pseudomassariella vexata]|uniref:Tafazzin n=1 Tax=Pseudomassariella vexata TaxID=1141098 RepID=A0A1Y2DVA2_9PEZI|nr:uncharacterized protein BCR38DRAFT_410029 [Pseudomassariella vexata]ORY63064.1 hypothetical protein BCR38DRAFT_410029 [Pseudomassariella vexata]